MMVEATKADVVRIAPFTSVAGGGGCDDGDVGVVGVACGAAVACGVMLALAAVAVVVGGSGAGGGRRRL